jgi:hypothetical protein
MTPSQLIVRLRLGELQPRSLRRLEVADEGERPNQLAPVGRPFIDPVGKSVGGCLVPEATLTPTPCFRLG